METTSTSLGGGLLPSTQPACLIFVKPEGGTMNFNSVSVAKTALLHQGVKRNQVRRFHCEKALAVVHVFAVGHAPAPRKSRKTFPTSRRCRWATLSIGQTRSRNVSHVTALSQ